VIEGESNFIGDNMAQTLLAIFNNSDEALSTVRALRREGVTGVELMSAEPIHDWQPEEASKSHIGLFAIFGAVLGATLATIFMVWTSRRVNINTGGMPIVTSWAFGIIAFEVAMLTAILASLVCTIFEARLARGNALQDYDEAVADNKIVLAVKCKDETSLSTAEQLLAETSAEVRQKD
jgi:hypothetical protein